MQLTVLHSRRSRYAPVDIIISIIQVSASPPGGARRLPGPGIAAPRRSVAPREYLVNTGPHSRGRRRGGALTAPMKTSRKSGNIFARYIWDATLGRSARQRLSRNLWAAPIKR